MRAYGISYDTGFVRGGGSSREPFDPEVVRRELRIIRGWSSLPPAPPSSAWRSGSHRTRWS